MLHIGFGNSLLSLVLNNMPEWHKSILSFHSQGIRKGPKRGHKKRKRKRLRGEKRGKESPLLAPSIPYTSPTALPSLSLLLGNWRPRTKNFSFQPKTSPGGGRTSSRRPVAPGNHCPVNRLHQFWNWDAWFNMNIWSANCLSKICMVFCD